MAVSVKELLIKLKADTSEVTAGLSSTKKEIDKVADATEKASKKINHSMGYTLSRIDANGKEIKQRIAPLAESIGEDFKKGAGVASDSIGKLPPVAEGAAKKMSGAFKGVALAIGAMVSVQALNFVSDLGSRAIKSADEFNQLSGKINNAVGDVDKAKKVLDQLFISSNKTGVDISSTAQAFVRLAPAAKRLGVTNNDLIKFTETIQKLGTIGGTGPAELAAGMLQLSQGIGSGRLQGDELRSTLENLQPVAQKVADEAIRRGLIGSFGELREAAAEGKISAELVFTAIMKGANDADAAFAKLPPSVSRSSNEMTNNWLKFLGELDKTFGITKLVSEGLDQVSKAIKNAATYIAENREAFKFWGEIVKSIITGLGKLFTLQFSIINNAFKTAIDWTNKTITAWEKAKKVWSNFTEQRRKDSAILEKENSGNWFSRGRIAGGAAPIDFQAPQIDFGSSGGAYDALGSDYWTKNLPNMGSLALLQNPETTLDSLNEIKSSMSELQNVAQDFGRKFEDTFIQAAMTGKFEFKGLVSSILEDLARLTLRKGIINPIVNYLSGGDSGGLIGKLFSSFGKIGKKATGGDTLTNRPYIVGEKGPELFMPGKAGRVMPNGQTMSALNGGGSSGTTIVQNLNFSLGVQETVRREIQGMMPQIASQTVSAVNGDIRYGGKTSRSVGRRA